MVNLKGFVIFALLLLNFSSASFAQSTSSSDAGKSKDDCLAEYNKPGGYKTKTQKQQDQAACKGTVGESFCITEKEETSIDQCRKQKAAAPPPAPIVVNPLEADPYGPAPGSGSEDTKPKDEKPADAEDADGFREM